MWQQLILHFYLRRHASIPPNLAAQPFLNIVQYGYPPYPHDQATIFPLDLTSKVAEAFSNNESLNMPSISD